MEAILIFLPFVLIPYLTAYIFNRKNYSEKWVTYFFTIAATILYAILFDFISSEFQTEEDQFQCRFPLVLLPIMWSPFILFLQLLFNTTIIKSVKYDE